MSRRTASVMVVVAFILGMTLGRLRTTKTAFLIRSPRVFLEYDIQETSYDVFRFLVIDGHLSSEGLLSTLSNEEMEYIGNAIEQKRANLAADREHMNAVLSEIEAVLSSGGRFYKYTHRGESGVLVLHMGRIVMRLPFGRIIGRTSQCFQSASAWS